METRTKNKEEDKDGDDDDDNGGNVGDCSGDGDGGEEEEGRSGCRTRKEEEAAARVVRMDSRSVLVPLVAILVVVEGKGVKGSSWRRRPYRQYPRGQRRRLPAAQPRPPQPWDPPRGSSSA